MVDVSYLENYINVDETIQQALDKHAKKYDLSEICAYYADMEDFYSDWCGLGYARTEARRFFHGGIGEFQKLPDEMGIVRFVV